MQYSTILISLLATAASAAPAPAPASAVSAMAAVQPWIIKSFTRTCNAADTSCTIKFGIDTQTGAAVVPCEYTVAGSPASRADTAATCGPYAVTSHWDNQFGNDRGFTTWAVVDDAQNIIAFPSYSDADIVNGKAVSPDRAFAPQTIWW
jgi:hypothetical protein